MRVAIIGGAEGSERTLRRTAAQLGHDLEYSAGHATDRRGTIERLMGRADMVIVIVGTCSHRAVEEAKYHARPGQLHLVRSFGVTRLRELLATTTTTERRT